MKPKKNTRKEVYAVWLVDGIGVDEDGESLPEYIHISTGLGDDQGEGYFLADPGAKLLIESVPSGLRVTFTAPALPADLAPGYWLSPCCLWPGEIEAVDFGARTVRS